VTVSDGSLSASLAAFSITVNAPAESSPDDQWDAPPAVTQGTAYAFTPTASDPDGNSLTFSIATTDLGDLQARARAR